MELISLFNQYEEDAVCSPLREKELNLNALKNKAVVVSGDGDIITSIVHSLLYCNEKRGLNMRVIAVGEGGRFPNLAQRSDFEEMSADNINDADFWFELGFYDDRDSFLSTDFIRSINRANGVISQLKRIKPAKTILLGSTAVYGRTGNGVKVSENEYGNTSYDSASLRFTSAQSLETLFASASKQYGFSCTTLRAAKLIAPFTELSVSEKILLPVIRGECVSFKAHGTKTSYIYINDLITALFYVLLKGKEGETYNACSDCSTVSPLELASLVDELFEGSNTAISDSGYHAAEAAVDSSLLKQLGWTPRVEIKDALLITRHALENSNEVFMFPDAYDGKLRAIQSVLLGFLLEVDRICRKHNIKYFLGGGTLLGAVRHKGFIPWDDDADVMMLREDYDKFLSVIDDELPPYIHAQTKKNEPSSHFPFLKLRIDDTVLSTEFSSRFPIHNGIFLDVLAQDKTSNDAFIRKLHMKATAQARWLVLNKWRRTPVDANNRFVAAVANFLKAIFPLGIHEAVQNKLMGLYKNKKGAKYLYDSMGRNVERGAFPIEWLDKAVYVDFEGVKLPIPGEYDKYLRYLYGDYMEMIPVSLRHVSHDMTRIDLGQYADYRTSENLKNE